MELSDGMLLYHGSYCEVRTPDLNNMLMEQAATVRKEWSTVCDSVIHEKPKFIKPIRDKMWVQELHK